MGGTARGAFDAEPHDTRQEPRPDKGSEARRGCEAEMQRPEQPSGGAREKWVLGAGLHRCN